MKYVFGGGVLIALALVLFIGCGVDSGARDGGSPGGIPGLPGGGKIPGGADPSQAEQEVFQKVNEERQKAGVKALEFCKGLGDCARAHSKDMHARNFFSHYNPEGEGPTERGRAGHAGSFTFEKIVPDPYYGIAENIAMGYTDPTSVMNGWMNSPGHRANILNGSYTHIGVGVCDQGEHWTQNFGTRGTGGGSAPGGGGSCPPGKG